MKIQKEVNKIRKILENLEKRMSKLEKSSQSEPSTKSELPSKEGNVVDITELAKKIGVDKDEIEKLFDIEENDLTVLIASNELGKNNKEKTKNIALLVLLGYRCFFGENEVFSKEIRRNIEENGIRTDNLATYLAEMAPSFVRRKGETRSPKTTYKMTFLGESTARELIKKLCAKDEKTE